MTYRKALELIQLAEMGDLMDDIKIRRLIYAVSRASNPRLERNAERYIGRRVVYSFLSRYE